MDKNIRTAAKTYRTILINEGMDNVDGRLSSFVNRLTDMYASEKFREHNVYPTMNVSNIYAVIAMCLELKSAGMEDARIINAVDKGFEKRRSKFKKIIALINILPNSFNIARKWNINDHAKRVDDKSITYDYFNVSKDKVEYRISKCMYVEMFESYGIRPLCRIFCVTDEFSYAGLTRHVKYIRHSELATGNTCWDEVIRK
jgi:hypothetical protein